MTATDTAPIKQKKQPEIGDSFILDWIERYMIGIRHKMNPNLPGFGDVVITWREYGKELETVGCDLRDAVRKAVASNQNGDPV